MLEPFMSPEDEARLHVSTGRALWAAEAFENFLGYLIVIVIKAPYETRADADLALRTEFGRTLGNLLREFRKYGGVGPDLDRRFDQFKAERDWLCHRMFAENSRSVLTQEGHDALCARLDCLYEEGLTLATLVNTAFHQWLEANGLAEEIDQLTREALRELGVQGFKAVAE